MRFFAFVDDATGEVITVGACPPAAFDLQSAPAGQTKHERPPHVECGWTWNGETFDPPAED